MQRTLRFVGTGLVLVACSKQDARPAADASPPAASALEGNAAAGMPAKSGLLALAKPGSKCTACFFNGRCALLTEGDATLPCCDYVGGKSPGDWRSSRGDFGRAAQCLATILDAPYGPAPAKGTLQPLAKDGAACTACFFNGRCALLTDGRVDAPCCDYVGGKKAGAWANEPDRAGAAECLANEAGVAYR